MQGITSRGGLTSVGRTAIVAVLALSFAPCALATQSTVCVPLPKAELNQGRKNATDVAEPVRQTMIAYMSGPAIELKTLDSRIPVQLAAEAQSKGCHYLVTAEVVQKSGGSMGSLFRKAAPFASVVPYVGGVAGSTTSVVASQAVGAMASAAAVEAAQQNYEQYAAVMSGAQQNYVKSGDTLRFGYALQRVGESSPVVKNTFEAKAESDGQDLLSGLIEKVATEVVGYAATNVPQTDAAAKPTGSEQ